MTNPTAVSLCPAPSLGTILVVEDEFLLRRVVVRLLGAAGYRTIPASGGVEALTALAEHRGSLHAVYLDLLLPDMPGEVVREHMRERYPAVPVVLTSGCDPPPGTLVGSDAAVFLPKPFSSSDLYDALARAVASVGAPGESAAPQLARALPATHRSDATPARYG